MLIHECSLAVTPCVSQVEDTDLTPATIKMDLLFAFGHFSICAKKKVKVFVLLFINYVMQ